MIDIARNVTGGLAKGQFEMLPEACPSEIRFSDQYMMVALLCIILGLLIRRERERF